MADMDLDKGGGGTDAPKKSYRQALIPMDTDVPVISVDVDVEHDEDRLKSPCSIKGYGKPPPLTPAHARIPRIPSPNNNVRKQTERMALQRENSRMKNPPMAVRMTTVAMTAKSRESTDLRRSLQESLRRPKKIITWDEATQARPPLRIDMDGPSPWSYSPHLRKPLQETNAPSFSFGRKTFVEKDGCGTRTSWEKTWFQNSEVWSQKADFHSDRSWPSPTTYRRRPMLGPKQRTVMEYPSYSIGVRRGTNMNKKGSEKEPGPCEYNPDRADVIILKSSPAFTHQQRRHGTILWGGGDQTPGPGTYNLQQERIQIHRPAFTIQGIRRERTHTLGPFAAL